jgi:hypothetical protein
VAVLLAILVIVLAAARSDQPWVPLTVYDPKITPGLAVVLAAGFVCELSILRRVIGDSDKHETRKALQWMGINAAAAALWGLPIGLVLSSSLFDRVGSGVVLGGAILVELAGVSLTAGSLWSKFRGTRYLRGIWVFVILNLASMASVLLAGLLWHLLYDWLDARGVWRMLYGRLGLWK